MTFACFLWNDTKLRIAETFYLQLFLRYTHWIETYFEYNRLFKMPLNFINYNMHLSSFEKRVDKEYYHNIDSKSKRQTYIANNLMLQNSINYPFWFVFYYPKKLLFPTYSRNWLKKTLFVVYDFHFIALFEQASHNKNIRIFNPVSCLLSKPNCNDITRPFTVRQLLIVRTN